MRIFITGVAGFLGSHVADKMIELGHEVIGVDNLDGGNLANVNPKVEFYKEDCNKLVKMKKYMKNFDVVSCCLYCTRWIFFVCSSLYYTKYFSNFKCCST